MTSITPLHFVVDIQNDFYWINSHGLRYSANVSKYTMLIYCIGGILVMKEPYPMTKFEWDSDPGPETSRDIPRGSRHPMIPPGFHWRHLETCWSLRKTYVDVRYIQWYLWILLERPGDLLEISRGIPQGSLHPMISPGCLWRHLETRWSLWKTHVSVSYIQWYLLKSAGDTWRLTGACTRHMSTFAASNDTSWILLATPGDLLEMSIYIHEPRGLLHAMTSPGFRWRHWETRWSLHKTNVDVCCIQW